MKITPDDPKLTAYALGELDATERAAIEAELEKSFVLQRAVEEIRETAKLLEKNLAAEELPGMTFSQQRKIENQLNQSGARAKSFPWWRILFYGGIGAAAVFVFATIILPEFGKSKSKPQQVAMKNTMVSQPKKDLPKPVVAETKIPAMTPVVETAPPIPVAPPPAPKTEPTAILASLNSGNASAPKELPPQPASGQALSSLNLSIAAMPAPQQNSPVVASGVVFNTSAGTGDSLVASSSSTANGKVNSRGGSGGGYGGGGGFGGGPDRVAYQGINESRLSGNNGYDSFYPGDNVATDQTADESEQAPRLGDAPLLGNRFYRVVQSPSGTATYPHLIENSFLTVLNQPLSTFSIDVDTASYANIRRFLNSNQLPPPDAVRIEEMINYFHYDYPQPRGEDPFSASIEVAGCPWNSEHRLVRIGLEGREIAQDKRPASSFVFLIDVSGSMQPSERLPLIKEALRELVKKMTENDRVAIVTYAGEAGVRLESTPCSEKEKILDAIDGLEAGGSTAGAAGIQAAYSVAQENFIEGGVNRVLLCTDGDFNVGVTDQSQLVKMIQDKAKGGVALTTLGVGTDNYKDALMQKLADSGNGNYFYLDTLEEAQKVLIDQMSGTLVTIAKDVKIQVEFNPAQVGAYRLIGYEKRMLRKEDFNNDKKDAGEIGAGHTVTALYEIVPAGGEIPQASVDDLKYQQPVEEKPVRYVTTGSKELLTLKLRYKQPDGDTSKLLEFPVTDGGKSFERASTDFKFATAVAEFGMLLRDSEFKGNSSYGSILELAGESKGNDAEGYRSEFLTLVQKARRLQQ